MLTGANRQSRRWDTETQDDQALGAAMDSRIILAGAIVFATLVGAWMFRYEEHGFGHRNKITGAICAVREECWFSHGRGYED